MERAIILTSPRPVGDQPERWKLEYRVLSGAWRDIVAGRDETTMTTIQVQSLSYVKDHLSGAFRKITSDTNRTHRSENKTS